MRFGVAPMFDATEGGVHQYSLTLMENLARIAAERRDDLVIVVDNAGDRRAAQGHAGAALEVMVAVPRSLRRTAVRAAQRLLGDGRARALARQVRRTLAPRPTPRVDDVITMEPAVAARLAGLRWIAYSTSNELALRAGIPFVSAIHDLQHRLQPEFPEVSADGRVEGRERLIRNVCRGASLLLADSDVGKEDILACYPGVSAERVVVLPYVPPPYLRQVAALAAPVETVPPYLFYPAQFWSHKNHLRLVEALALLREAHVDVDLVLSGSHSGELRVETFRALQARIKALGLGSRIRYLGYVPSSRMIELYRGATALVMPTFFGPTNIPILEAWAARCPVITSDIRGVREQAGDAAVLVDPRDPAAIAAGIRVVVESRPLRDALRERGVRRLAAYTEEDFVARLRGVVDRMAPP